MERRISGEAVELEKREDGTAVVSGYAAVFYRKADPGSEYELWKDTVERIMPEAFDRAIKEADDTRALFNHDSNHVLGRSASGTLRLTTDKRGLRYEIDMPDTQIGRDVAESIRRGDVSGSSFAFQVTAEEWRTEKSREIREVRGVKLFDVGPVVFPAYKSTTSGVRADELAECRESRDRWHELDKAEREAAKAEARGKLAVREKQVRELELLGEG